MIHTASWLLNLKKDCCSSLYMHDLLSWRSFIQGLASVQKIYYCSYSTGLYTMCAMLGFLEIRIAFNCNSWADGGLVWQNSRPFSWKVKGLAMTMTGTITPSQMTGVITKPTNLPAYGPFSYTVRWKLNVTSELSVRGTISCCLTRLHSELLHIG